MSGSRKKALVRMFIERLGRAPSKRERRALKLSWRLQQKETR